METKKAVLIIFILGFTLFFLSLFNQFVWDDEEQIINNGLVHSISNFGAFFQGSTFNSGGAGGLGGLYYKPLMTIFFSLFYTFLGPNPFFFHFFQLIFHLTNTALAFVLFRNIFPKNKKYSDYLSFFLALIFLVHPINVETVIYSSSLQDILYMFFGLVSLLFLIKKELNLRKIILLSFFLLLSLLSKETGAVFILICLLYSYFYQKTKFISVFSATIITLLTYSFLRFAVAQVFFGRYNISPITKMSFLERLPTIPKIIAFYLITFIFPLYLSISQRWAVNSFNFNDFLLPLALSLVVFAGLVTCQLFLYKSKSELSKPFFFFFSWFILSLGLHLQIFPLDMTVAERWFYLPEIGLLGVIGVLILNSKILSPKTLKPLIILGCLVLAVLSIRSFIRTMDWKNGLSLYTADEKITPNSFDLENNLGVELFRANRTEEAKVHFEKSTQVAPFWWTNWNNLGAILEKEKNYPKAQEYYKKSIDNGHYYLAYENYGNILWIQGKYEEDKKYLEGSLKLLPQNPRLWLILSLVNYKLGNKEQALLAAKQSFILSPTEQSYNIISKLEKGQELEFGAQ